MARNHVKLSQTTGEHVFARYVRDCRKDVSFKMRSSFQPPLSSIACKCVILDEVSVEVPLVLKSRTSRASQPLRVRESQYRP